MIGAHPPFSKFLRKNLLKIIKNGGRLKIRKLIVFPENYYRKIQLP